MNIFISFYSSEIGMPQWYGSSPSNAQKSLLYHLPPDDKRYSLAVGITRDDTFLLAMNNLGEQKLRLLVELQEDADARSLALAYLLHHDDLCREVLACVQGQGAAAQLNEVKLKQALSSLISREPVQGTSPRYSPLHTNNADEVVACLRNKRFRISPGLKLIISDSFSIERLEEDEDVDIWLRTAAAAKPGLPVEKVVLCCVIGLLLVGGAYALFHRPKIEPAPNEPGSAQELSVDQGPNSNASPSSSHESQLPSEPLPEQEEVSEPHEITNE